MEKKTKTNPPVVKEDKTADGSELKPSKVVSKEQFLQEIREDLNASGFKDKHHPDMHHLGASKCCPGCDTGKESADQMWEAK